MNDFYKISAPSIRIDIFKKLTFRLLKVNSDSNKSTKNALYKMALYFKREFQYDFVQYDQDENDDKNTKCFIFCDPEYDNKVSAYGGCVFRYRAQWENIENHWALQWIWLHPFRRNRGILSAEWGNFQRLFGDNFMVESPLSASMEQFLKAKNCFEQHTDYERLKK